MKKKLMLLPVVCLMILTACQSTDSTQSLEEANQSSDATINMMEINEISTMDSRLALDGGSFIAITQVIEGLYNLDETDQIIPGVATSLPDISQDGLTYTIQLRDNATWSNGTPVTADDFVYAWQTVVDPDFGSPSHFLLFDVKNAASIFEGKTPKEELGITALNDHKLEITLEQPSAYFTSVLTFPTLFPINREFAEKEGKSYAIDSEHLLYNGPYSLSHWQPSQQTWTYQKNNKYWNKGSSNVDTIHIQVIKDSSLAYNLYDTGELDRAVLSGEFAKQEKNNPDYTTQLDSWVHTLEMNQTGLLASKEAREAIGSVIDREHITNDLLDDGSQPIYGLIPHHFVESPESHIDFRELSGSHVSYDLDKGKDLWKQVPDEGRSLSLLVSDSEDGKRIAEYLQEQLESQLTGLTVSITSLPEKALLEKKDKHEFDLLLTRQGPDFQDPTTFLNKYQTDAFDNPSNYHNPVFDQLLEQAQIQSVTPDTRFNTLVKAESLLLEDNAVIPLYQSANTALLRPNIDGMIHHLFGPPNYYGKINLK